MKIAVGADHGGVELKALITDHLEERGIEVVNYGTDSSESVDYPDFAHAVTHAVQEERVDYGILICGTGIGMSITANKEKGIRAALCGDVFSAQATKAHNNANVLCLGARVVGPGLALMIVDAWLDADYEGGRHQKRLDKIAAIENAQDN